MVPCRDTFHSQPACLSEMQADWPCEQQTTGWKSQKWFHTQLVGPCHGLELRDELELLKVGFLSHLSRISCGSCKNENSWALTTRIWVSFPAVVVGLYILTLFSRCFSSLSYRTHSVAMVDVLCYSKRVHWRREFLWWEPNNNTKRSSTTKISTNGSKWKYKKNYKDKSWKLMKKATVFSGFATSRPKVYEWNVAPALRVR